MKDWSMRCIGAILLVLAAAVLGTAQPAASDADYRLQAAEKTLRDRNVATDGPALLEFFRRRTLSQTELDSLSTKIKQLGAASYKDRARAAADLVAAGAAARPLLLDVVKY